MKNPVFTLLPSTSCGAVQVKGDLRPQTVFFRVVCFDDKKPQVRVVVAGREARNKIMCPVRLGVKTRIECSHQEFAKRERIIVTLRPAKEFKCFKLRPRDRDIGKAKEFYFDDEHWAVRYLVADTGGWLSGKRVLISPHALDPANEAEQVLPVNLTKKQIEKSPSLASDQPVSRQHEMQHHGYYGWPMYWSGPYLWGQTANPGRHCEGWLELSGEPAHREVEGDPHLHRRWRTFLGNTRC